MGETLTVVQGADGLRALLVRAKGLDSQAVARFQVLKEGVVDVFVTTPFGVLAARRIGGSPSRDGATVTVSNLLDALAAGSRDGGPACDFSFPGALPPKEGYRLVDILPVMVVRDLAEKGQSLAKQFSGPMGPPASLLDQTVLTVTGDGNGEKSLRAHIPMRMIFTCTALGLIPQAGAPDHLPRQVRVSVQGGWVRLDAPFGSVYFSRSPKLFPL